MSNINLIICYIKNWIEDKIAYIVAILFIFVIATAIYGQADRDIKKAQEKGNRINRIETRLEQQMNYIHQPEDDVDNLYREVE